MTRAARLITHLFAPATVIALTCLAVGLYATDNPFSGIGWGLAAALGTAVLPMAVIAWGVRRGKITDVHVRQRRQRLIPLSIAIATAALGTLTLWLTDAPRPIQALSAGLLASVITMTAITVRWKISFHAGVAAGGTVVLALANGPAALAALALVAAIAWSRVRLRDHTLAQVLAGAVWGAAVMGSLYALLS